jgi:hypothetical protein
VAQSSDEGLWLLAVAGVAMGFWYANSCRGFLADTVQLPRFPLCGSSPSAGSSGTSGTSGVVEVLPAPVSIPVQNVGSAAVGRPYRYQWRASGGVPPYKWMATGLPPGLSMSASGLLSGTPTRAGTFTLTVMVTDALGRKASRSTPFRVAGVAIHVLPQAASATLTRQSSGLIAL